MHRKISKAAALALGAALLLGGCSHDKKAAREAGAAQQALDLGQVALARQHIQAALALRDDVPEYWLLLAHIALANRDLAGAFDAYENLLSLDHQNQEALTRLCQIAIAGGSPERAARYADQLSLVSADDTLPKTIKAGIALKHGDNQGARRLLDEVLAAHPGEVGALLLQGKLLAATGDYAGAARSVERSLQEPGEPGARLGVLLGYYQQAHDRAGYARTLARIARDDPDDSDQQLAYADLLYDQGDGAAALGVIHALMQRRATDIGVAAAILNLWLKEGAGAMPPDAIVSGAAGLSVEMRAAYAQYAIETGRPELAIRILPDLPRTPLGPANGDAKATLAYAQALGGDAAGGRATLDAILAADPRHPRALLARGRLRAAAGDGVGGVEDLRQAVASDPDNIAARLALADVLQRQKEDLLAENVLREALQLNGGDPRVAVRLARLLGAQGRRADAAGVLRDYARSHPDSQRAARLAAS